LPYTSSLPTEAIPSFNLIFNSEIHSDVTLIIDDKQIKAHRVILAMRNEAMFSCMYKEATQKTVTLKDFEYEIIFTFIKFLYTDECEITENNAVSLLVCCNHYCDKVLQNRCERFLLTGISISSV